VENVPPDDSHKDDDGGDSKQGKKKVRLAANGQNSAVESIPPSDVQDKTDKSKEAKRAEKKVKRHLSLNPITHILKIYILAGQRETTENQRER